MHRENRSTGKKTQGKYGESELKQPAQKDAVKLQQPAEETAAPKSFMQRPSVGTWCVPKPAVKSEACAAKPAEKAIEYPKFQLRPSVGTWCAARLPVEPEVPQVPVFREWKLRPSVGTWCAELPCEEPTDESSYRTFQLRPSVGTWCVAKPQRSLEELIHWEPHPHETAAMDVILKGRMKEIRDLTEKLRDVNSTLELAKKTGSGETGDLETAALALESCITHAQIEYGALEQWSTRRGFSQPSSPVQQSRDI